MKRIFLIFLFAVSFSDLFCQSGVTNRKSPLFDTIVTSWTMDSLINDSFIRSRNNLIAMHISLYKQLAFPGNPPDYSTLYPVCADNLPPDFIFSDSLLSNINRSIKTYRTTDKKTMSKLLNEKRSVSYVRYERTFLYRNYIMIKINAGYYQRIRARRFSLRHFIADSWDESFYHTYRYDETRGLWDYYSTDKVWR